MFFRRKTPELCRGDWDQVLPDICAIIGAEYEEGEIDTAEEQFRQSGEAEWLWTRRGSTGCEVVVKFEEHEAYLFGWVTGRGRAFREAFWLVRDWKELL